jgi:hypothetical protein
MSLSLISQQQCLLSRATQRKQKRMPRTLLVDKSSASAASNKEGNIKQ